MYATYSVPSFLPLQRGLLTRRTSSAMYFYASIHGRPSFFSPLLQQRSRYSSSTTPLSVTTTHKSTTNLNALMIPPHLQRLRPRPSLSSLPCSLLEAPSIPLAAFFTKGCSAGSGPIHPVDSSSYVHPIAGVGRPLDRFPHSFP